MDALINVVRLLCVPQVVCKTSQNSETVCAKHLKYTHVGIYCIINAWTHVGIYCVINAWTCTLSLSSIELVIEPQQM